MKCDECGHVFLNYDSWNDETEIHPETGTTPLVLECPECGDEKKRLYADIDPRSDQ